MVNLFDPLFMLGADVDFYCTDYEDRVLFEHSIDRFIRYWHLLIPSNHVALLWMVHLFDPFFMWGASVQLMYYSSTISIRLSVMASLSYICICVYI